MKKLLVIKKYINKYFNKSFIRINILLVATLILLTKKLGGGIRICVNYKKLNNVIIKNRYLILLIYKTLNILYYARYYIKLNIVVTFN